MWVSLEAPTLGLIWAALCMGGGSIIDLQPAGNIFRRMLFGRLSASLTRMATVRRGGVGVGLGLAFQKLPMKGYMLNHVEVLLFVAAFKHEGLLQQEGVAVGESSDSWQLGSGLETVWGI